MTGAPGAPPTRPIALVWIDERRAVIVRWAEGRATLQHLESEVPPRRRSTAQVRHVPGIRHGGGGVPQTAGEPHRLEHLARFVDEVSAHLAHNVDVVIVGPGTVRDRLRHRLLDTPHPGATGREVASEPAERMSDRQLIARLRDLVGAPAPRGRAGAYRWTAEVDEEPNSNAALPRRVPHRPSRDESVEAVE